MIKIKEIRVEKIEDIIFDKKTFIFFEQTL